MLTGVGQSARKSAAAALLAVAIGAALDVGYVLIVRSQGYPVDSRVVFYVAFVAVVSAVTLVGAVVVTLDRRLAQPLLYGAATGYFLTGALGIASVGMPLIVAGVVSIITVGRRRASFVVITVAATIPAATFLIGLMLT